MDIFYNEESYEEIDSSNKLEKDEMTESYSKDISKKYTEYEVNGITIIDDDMFAQWYDDVYTNLEFMEYIYYNSY